MVFGVGVIVFLGKWVEVGELILDDIFFSIGFGIIEFKFCFVFSVGRLGMRSVLSFLENRFFL